MRRIASALLACLLLFGLAACGAVAEQLTETQAITESTEAEFTTQPTEPEITTQPTEPEIATQIIAAIDPDFDAEALFKRLEGVWNDDYEILGFVSFIYEDGKPNLCFGPYDNKSSGIGKLVGGQSTGEDKAELSFLFPGNAEGVEAYMRDDVTVTVRIDFTGLDGEKIDMQLVTYFEIGEWETYAYGGKAL